MQMISMTELFKYTFDPRWYIVAYRAENDILVAIALVLFEAIHTVVSIISPRAGAKIDIILTIMMRGW